MDALHPVLAVVWIFARFAVPLGVLIVLLDWLFRKARTKSGAPARGPGRTQSSWSAASGHRAREKGLAFEQELKELLELDGCQVELTPASGDFGTDLIVTMKGRKYALQAKNTRGPVKENAVQQAHGGMLYYRCDGAILVSIGGVTDEARRLAAQIGVQIWDWATVSQLRKKHGRTPPSAVHNRV